MVQRVWILNGENITYDKDFAAYFFSLAETWVYEWLEVQSWRILQGKAIITITRTNWEKAAIFFENTESIQIDTSWNKKIFISFDEQKINFWQSNNEDGTWIANITSAPNYPTKNFLPLASITNWQITDERIWVTLRDDLIWRKIYKKNEVYTKDEADWRFVNITWDEEITWIKTFKEILKIISQNWSASALFRNETVNKDYSIWVNNGWEFFLWHNWKNYFKSKDDWFEFGVQLTTTQTTPLWDHSLVTKWYVGLEIDKKIQQAINWLSGRSSRIDTYLYG